MDSSSAFSWLSDMELEYEDSVFQCDFLGSLDVEDQIADFETTTCPHFSFENNNNNKLHQMINSSMMPNDFPAGRQDPNNAPIINNLQFGGNPNSPGQLEQQVIEELRPEEAKKKRRARPASQIYDHIAAERKRREQINQGFVTLSSTVPGLKKMDKISVLEDAIKYLKHLQERVNSLEEERAKQQTMEPRVVLLKKSQLVADDKINNTRLITIRIQCERKRGVLVNLLSKIEKLNLVVVNTNVFTFAGFLLDITVTAQMEQEFKLTPKEAVKQLRSSLNI